MVVPCFGGTYPDSRRIEGIAAFDIPGIWSLIFGLSGTPDPELLRCVRIQAATPCRHALNQNGDAMADLHKLLFETPATVTDREVLATARLNARVKEFAGQVLEDGIIDRINDAIADEADRLVADGVLHKRPDWLAVLVSRRLYVAFGSEAVQQLSRELRRMGAV